VLIIACTFLIAGSSFAAGSDGNPGISEITEIPENGTVSRIVELKNAPLNPEFVEYRNRMALESMSGSIVSSRDIYSDGNRYAVGLVPAPADLSGTGRSLLSGPETPEAYDLREEGLLTSVKNQGRAGSCWAFASLASLESGLLKAEGENRDFSENNMKNLLSYRYPEGFDLPHDAGGNRYMSTAYLARWTGPVNETDDLYNDVSDYSPLGLPVQKHVQEVLFLPERSGPLDNDQLKRALMNYGAVYTTMYADMNNYYFASNCSYYYYNTGIRSANHAITIVGWNDSFNMTRFSPQPPGDGAFIIKNSWGTSWGEAGYFYISYYDTKLGYDENAVFISEAPVNYDYSYQYDPFGWVSQMGYEDNTAWGANVFSARRNETLRAVSFYTTDSNTSYEIYVYKDPDSGPINTTTLELHESGKFTFPGYHTHELGSPVTLDPGQVFSVVIKFSNPDENPYVDSYPLAYEYPEYGWSTKARANPGESYTSPDGETWEDLTSRYSYSNANLCIKAFSTTEELPDADFSADVSSGVPPLTVQFTDLSENAFSWEWDTDGDGNVDYTTRDPEHSYELYGTYNVTLDVSNRNGESSKTKTVYISVEPLSISSSSPAADLESFDDETAEFNISTNYPCTISWYLDGTEIKSGAGISASSYTSSTAVPGVYNVTATAEEGYESRQESWNWTVRDWNPWDNPDSEEGTNVTTEELQKSIHCYLNGLEFTESGANSTNERLGQLIQMWLEE